MGRWPGLGTGREQMPQGGDRRRRLHRFPADAHAWRQGIRFIQEPRHVVDRADARRMSRRVDEDRRRQKNMTKYRILNTNDFSLYRSACFALVTAYSHEFMVATSDGAGQILRKIENIEMPRAMG